MVWGHPSPHCFGAGGDSFFFWGNPPPPLIGEAEGVVAAEPMGACNRDPNHLQVTTGDRLVVNH